MARLFGHLPLRIKLFVGMIVPVLVLVSGGLALAIAGEHRQQLNRVHESTGAVVAALTNELHRAVLLRDQEASVEVTERLRIFEQIERLWVVDQEQTLLFAYSRPGLLPSVPPDSENSHGPDWMHVTLEAQGNQIGTAVVHLSLDEQHAATARRVWQAVGFAAGLLAIGMVLVLYLAGSLAAPIRDLSAFVVQTARTLDTSARVAVTDRYEIGALAQAVNLLLAEITANRRVLEQTNERIEAEVEQRTRELRASERRIRTLATHAPVGIFETDSEGRCLFVNRAWIELCGCEPDDAVARHWIEVVHPEDRSRIESEWGAAVKSDGEYTSECRILTPDDRVGWVSLGVAPLRTEQGVTTGYLGTFSDLTDRKRMEEQLRFGAFHDRLTGLANRTQLCERLGEVIGWACETATYQHAVLYLDFDRFKWINDTLGHQAGDAFLVAAADRIRLAAGEGARKHGAEWTASRLGGDEFVILLEGVREQSHAMEIAGSVCAALAEPYIIDGADVTSSASIGLAYGSGEHKEPNDLLREADAAMYRRKTQGRCGITVFDETMRDAAISRALLERELRHAVEHREFELHYQPIIELVSRRPVGFETLIRWRHPTRGILPPAEFLPVVEETGLIVEIGRWVLLEACRQGRCWRTWMPDLASLHVGVNLSARHIEAESLINDVKDALEESGLKSESLVIEVTESSIMRDIEKSSSAMGRLRDLGVRVSMDDFGTGYSSLAYLRSLPLDMLKIDRSFVTGLTADKRTMAILQAIVELARNLDVTVVAEGVESSQELAALLALDCQMVQGYLFARPMPADDVPAWCVRACAPNVRVA